MTVSCDQSGGIVVKGTENELRRLRRLIEAAVAVTATTGVATDGRVTIMRRL